MTGQACMYECVFAGDRFSKWRSDFRVGVNVRVKVRTLTLKLGLGSVLGLVRVDMVRVGNIIGVRVGVRVKVRVSKGSVHNMEEIS